MLERFRDFQSSEDDLIDGLHGLLEINFQPALRQLNSHHAFLEPGVSIAMSHIRSMKEKLASGTISRTVAERWVALILLYDVFDLERPENDEVTEELHAFAELPQTASS